MAYTPTVWKNGEFPPIDAEHLNKIEQGIANSAPGGFGWGNTLDYLQSQDGVTTYADFCGMIDGVANTMPGNTAKLIVARGPSETGQYSGAHNMLAILNVGDTSGEVELTGLAPGQNSQGGLWRMIKKSGTWGDPEWINPPMELGVEYRTTERYLGKPLYKKLIEFPSLTGRDYQQVHGRDGFVISAIGEVRSPQDTNFWMPMVVNPVAGQADAPFPTIAFANFYSADVGVVCASTSEYIGQPARVLVTYYKTTD